MPTRCGCCSRLKGYWRYLVLFITPVILSPIIVLYEEIGLTQKACSCLYMMLLMAVYWCTETLPLAGTALVPLVLAPMMGILEASIVCKNYFTDKIALFIGSLLIATAIQHSDLHKRIALNFIRLFGTNPHFLTLGFMVPTWFLSMWISNTATTAMMVTIVNCVILQLETQSDLLTDGVAMKRNPESEDSSNIGDVDSGEQRSRTESKRRFQSIAKCLSLAVCYSATCGGIATLTGTGTNLVFYDQIVIVGKRLDFDFNITLSRWMLFAFPLSTILLICCWIWIQIFFFGIKRFRQSAEDRKLITAVINQQLKDLGRITWREAITLIHFAALALLWLTRNTGGSGGWEKLFMDEFVSDATAAILVSVSLLSMPRYPPRLLTSSSSCKPFEPLLPWKVVSEKLSWGTVLLIGGGFALADCVNKSGLSEAIGNSLRFVSSLPVWVMILLICLITAVITEFSSNVAISALFVPIIADLAISQKMNPLLLMLPVTIAASFAFMLPAATPPNAIVYSSGHIKIKDMMVAGFVMNLLAIFFITVSVMTWAGPVFHFDDFSYSSFSNASSGINHTAISV